jgi:hypothetical protein
MNSPLIWAWPCGHEVRPDECRCMKCYRATLYGTPDETEIVRLFTPAPAQMPGQTGLDL